MEWQYKAMTTLPHAASRLAANFSRAALWRREFRIWGQAARARTFERWLYLAAHRAGLMGRAQRAALERLVEPGMRVLDVGANLGLYTVLLARRAGPNGRIVAFEPDPELADLLRENCALNGCANVDVHAVALGQRNERLRLHRLVLNSGDNSLGARDGGWFREQVEVEVVALDAYLPDLRADFVKIDVQGWEVDVLRGMERLLAAGPRLYVEFWPWGLRRAGRTPEELVAFLTDRGYRLHAGATGGILSREQLDRLVAEAPSSKRYTDLYAAR